MFLCVYDCEWLHLCETRERERESVMKEKGKNKVETSVERAPGQKAEVQSAKMTTLEYESMALDTLGT